MAKREVISETLMEPQKIEGTTEQVAQGVINKILWPTIAQLAKQDRDEAMHFCNDLIACLTGCLVKVSGDKTLSIAALKEVQIGVGAVIATIEKLPANPTATRH